MKNRKVLWILGALLVVMGLLLTACGGNDGGGTASDVSPTEASSSGNGGTGSSGNGGGDDADNGGDAEPEPPAEPQDEIPENIVVHPEAFEFEVTAASDTYVYWVPLMVADATEYFVAEMEAIGWELVSKPTVMGHLATIIMEHDGARVTLSLQDNEHKEATRVQVRLVQQ